MNPIFNPGNIRREYCEFRNHVLEELKRNGYYPWRNVTENGRSIHYIVYLAITDAYIAYIKNESPRNESDDRYSGTGQRWIDIYKITIKNLAQIHSEFTVFEKKALECFEQRKAKSFYSNSADTPYEHSPADSKAVEDAKKEAEQIIEQAKNNAKQLESDAKNKADAIISDAKTQQQTLIEEGNAKKQALIEEGLTEKQRIIEDITEQQYKDGLEKCIKEHFNEAQLEERQIRENLDSEYDFLIQEKNDMLDSLNTQAASLHSSIVLTLDDALSNLQSIQNDIHNQLSLWQRNLYRSELQGLAMCFMNLDKIITSIENKIASHLAFGEEGYHKELADELSQTVKNLKILKKSFESSLAKNSIKLLIPAIGESFNINYHRAENIDPATEDEDSFNGRPITSVCDAGLIRVLNSGDETIQRAVVTVEK